MVQSKSNISYISKGQRPNVARKTVNLIRQERRANPPIEDMFKRRNHRQGIIDKPRGKKEQELRDRYLDEDRVSLQAFKLMDQYRDVHLLKSTAIQAVMTNFTEQLHAKWGPRLKNFRDSKKSGRKEEFINQSKN